MSGYPLTSIEGRLQVPPPLQETGAAGPVLTPRTQGTEMLRPSAVETILIRQLISVAMPPSRRSLSMELPIRHHGHRVQRRSMFLVAFR